MTAADNKIRNICETAYESFKDLVNDFHRFYIALYDKTNSKMRFPFVIENDRPFDYLTRPFNSRYLPDYAISTKEIIKLNRDEMLVGSNNDNYIYWPENDILPVSVVCSPLLAGESVLGVLVVEKRAGTSGISNSDFLYIDEISQQVAVAIDRYYLYESLEGKVKERTEQLEKKTKAQEAVHEIGVKLTEGIQLGEKKILEIIKQYADWVMDTENMYIALYDPDPNDQPEENLLYGVIRYGLMYVDGKFEEMPTREAVPGEFGRTEVILATQKPILNKTREESEKWHKLPGHTNHLSGQFGDFASWLGVPMIASGKSIGVIATYHKSQEYLYSEDDKQVLTMMASNAATVIENAWLYQNLEDKVKERTEQLQEKNEQLEKKTKAQEAVHDIGVKLTEGIQLGEEKILELIKEHADRVMDANNMYIALYDPDPTKPDILDLDHPQNNQVHGKLKFGLMYVDGEPKDMPSRNAEPGKYGRTEVILATGKPILNKTRRESEEWYSLPGHENFLASEESKKKESFAAWLGVPMIAGGKPIGVIATYHKIKAYLYDEDDQQALMMMANHAATAIENSGLYSQMDTKIQEKTEQLYEERRQKLLAENIAAFNNVAGELAHKMNNFAGTIPTRVSLIKEKIDDGDPNKQKIYNILAGIERDSVRLLEEARRIRESTNSDEPVTKEDLNEILKTAFRTVRRSFQSNLDDNRIKCCEEYMTIPLFLEVPKNSFQAAIENIIRNGAEALTKGGELKLCIQLLSDKEASIVISDTGHGIENKSLPHIFDPFYTTKSNGFGFGLWQAKTVVNRIGGHIEVLSEMDKGTTFKLYLPLYSQD